MHAREFFFLLENLIYAMLETAKDLENDRDI